MAALGFARQNGILGTFLVPWFLKQTSMCPYVDWCMQAEVATTFIACAFCPLQPRAGRNPHVHVRSWPSVKHHPNSFCLQCVTRGLQLDIWLGQLAHLASSFLQSDHRRILGRQARRSKIRKEKCNTYPKQRFHLKKGRDSVKSTQDFIIPWILHGKNSHTTIIGAIVKLLSQISSIESYAKLREVKLWFISPAVSGWTDFRHFLLSSGLGEKENDV